MRLGIAGVGRIGVLHAENLVGHAAVREVLVADADGARARQVAERLGARAVDAVEDLFEAGLDGLVVAAPTDAHAGLVVRAVAAGIPVFCEKPVAPDIAGTVAVLARVADSGVPVQVGFQRRFDPGYVAAREAVRSGRLGRVHSVLASTLDPAPPPAAYVAISGGILRDCSVHDFDIVRWVTGREVVSVYAVGANHGADYIRAAGDVDAVAALLTLDDGSFAHVGASRYNAAGYDVRMELRGSDDCVSVGLDDRTPLRPADQRVPGPAGPAYAGFLERFRAAYAAELAAFVDLAAGSGSSPCTVSDALAAFHIAEACDRSRREGRPVALGEVTQAELRLAAGGEA
jgi:myo-inositol 2-dehydrogenase/D-chiro-inositol 1-dehydrogenase